MWFLLLLLFFNGKLHHTWGSVGQGKVLGILESR